MQDEYSEAYYREYDIGSSRVSYLESPELRAFHASVARTLIADFHPKITLDAGCAMGILVSELRKAGVSAYGIDFSEYAVTHADPIAVPYCFHGSLADPFPESLPRHFDVVTCMEVLEHMTPEDGRAAIRNLCAVTDTILFCSTPDDFADPTHINVQEREYWAACFAENGFFDDLNYRPLYMTSYAVCYRKRAGWLDQLADYERYVRQADAQLADYERYVRQADAQLADFRDSHYRALEHEHEKAVSEWTQTAGELRALQERYNRLSAENAEKSEKLTRMQERCGHLHAELEKSQALAASAQQLALAELARSDAAQAQLAAITQSKSWIITSPFRFVLKSFRRLLRVSAHFARRARNWLRRKLAPSLPDGAAAAAFPAPSAWPPRIGTSRNDSETKSVPVHGRRLLLYAFYDREGIVDGYVSYFLEHLKPWTEQIVVISNGRLCADSKNALEALGCEIIERENRGFDAWGIREGIMRIGFDKLAEYDEVLIANNTLLGPVCTLDTMFGTMSARKADFWGINMHTGIPDSDPFGCNPYGFIPPHIQSFFYAVRAPLIRSEAFRRFWTELPALPDYSTAVGLYETVMTRYLTDAGFVCTSLMDPDLYGSMTDNPLIAMPSESLRDWGSPFFKRRVFFQDYDYLTTFTGQQSASCLMQYLREETDYPLALVWENLIRTCHMSDLARNMHLCLVFDSYGEFDAQPAAVPLKSALFMHIYDAEMAPELARYAESMPVSADIYISTVSEEKKTAIANAFASLPNRVEIRVLPNRGRDVSALLTSFRDVVMKYDVACVTHDKKTGYLKPQTVGEGFAYMGYENILASSAFTAQVLHAFVSDPYLGLLCAPDPSHADFASHIGLEWGANFKCTAQLASELGLHVPMDEAHPPMAPFGSSFWFRTKALQPLFDKPWCYEDFPEEPFTMTDGSILHAIERIYPYAAQEAGYYTATLMTLSYAAVDIGNLGYYARSYTHACTRQGVVGNFLTVRGIAGMRMDESK